MSADFHPAAKCLLLTEWGYGPAPAEILQAHRAWSHR